MFHTAVVLLSPRCKGDFVYDDNDTEADVGDAYVLLLTVSIPNEKA